jgi:D-alanyl-D-alanine carboxypeptidase
MDIHHKLQSEIEDERQMLDLPARVLRVVAPRLNLAHTFATGVADRATGRPITGDEPFRIASITKTFTAASVLRLMEQGKLALDDPIDGLLEERYVTALRDGGYDPRAMTVRTLLHHRSGLHDLPDEVLSADLSRRWTPYEQVRLAVEGQGRGPLAQPGEVFAYTDIGYTLLARIVEGITGLPQAEAFRRTLRFDALGLRHTWFESLEPAPPDTPAPAHQYWRGRDTSAFDPSLDLFGGGGLMSTVSDLTTFFRTLMTGQAFDSPSTLRSMTSIPEKHTGHAYGMGLRRLEVNGVEFWGHSGYWGSDCFHAPALDLTVATTRNMAEEPEGYDRLRYLHLLTISAPR